VVWNRSIRGGWRHGVSYAADRSDPGGAGGMEAAMAASRGGSRIAVLAFDVYGTLVDPIRVWTRLQANAPDQAVKIAELWRQKQLEYSFRLTAMERYQDFEWVTARALEYALASTGTSLTEPQVAGLLAQYDDLEPFADVGPGLAAIGEFGLQMVAFSNGSPRMLAAVLASSGLASAFSQVISVDDVRAFKPSPRVYQHLLARVAQPADRVLLVSSNPFDVIGAMAVGVGAAWVNRAGTSFDTIAAPPHLVIRSLGELADAV
jgi:2-haloacid dehalogenase